MAETELTNTEVDAIQALQATGEQTAGAGPGGYQYSKQYETYLRKMTRQENKILTRFAPAAGGRVYKDGDLTFGVEAMEWLNGDTLVTKAEQTAQALTNAATNYIYYDAGGSLAVNITGFPTPSEFSHIRLATILTAGGTYAYDDITDKRQQGLVSVAEVLDPIFYEGDIVSYEDNIVYAS
jgi:hypothetical protein|tara:strand:- start:2115 stop:2657 length:543 start_codon:yes stop_codon:yes gene_type:complete